MNTMKHLTVLALLLLGPVGWLILAFTWEKLLMEYKHCGTCNAMILVNNAGEEFCPNGHA